MNNYSQPREGIEGGNCESEGTRTLLCVVRLRATKKLTKSHSCQLIWELHYAASLTLSDSKTTRELKF